MLKLDISTIFVHIEVKDDPITGTILAHYNNIPVSICDNIHQAYDNIRLSNDPVQAGKRHLILCKNNGEFIKKCPGTKSYICCGYQILHFAGYCNMDCSYCILQTYFHPPVLQYFVNHDRLFEELDKILQSRHPQMHRIGTGEFTDSLIWEGLTDLTSQLISRFACQDHAILELKTKTVNIKALKHSNHCRKTIIAWSLNTPFIIKTQERHTTPLLSRLKAAAQCQTWGYPLAFHFDPIVIYDGCEIEYESVIHELFSYVSPDSIVWISLGTFRYMPGLKTIIQNRFPDSKIIYEEHILGLDSKFRYLQSIRINIYEVIVKTIRTYAPGCCIYFCMENQTIWKHIFGFIPEDPNGLAKLLDQSAAKHCGIKINS